MDDEVPAELSGRLYGERSDYYETPTGKVERWSCVDYVDTIHEDYEKATRERKAKKPDSGGLRERFGKLDGHDARRGDKEGKCTETLPVNARGDNGWTAITVICSKHIGRRGLRGDTHGTHRWYKEKQTNRGWPGTAEGKINTAQGMAGDLVGNLNNDEKDTVAQILTKNVSGAEVVYVRCLCTNPRPRFLIAQVCVFSV